MDTTQPSSAKLYYKIEEVNYEGGSIPSNVVDVFGNIGRWEFFVYPNPVINYFG